MKLVIVDLDGTLFDTKDVNYWAYKEAVEVYGYDIDYKYYCDFCNGRHYLDFLPKITTNDKGILEEMHYHKKTVYKKYLDKAVLNKGLLMILESLKDKCKIALVTTASRKNCLDILQQFDLMDVFDLILTHEDVANKKPNPEGFLKAMSYFSVKPEETIIFEDSDVGLEAAKKSGAYYYKTYRYN